MKKWITSDSSTSASKGQQAVFKEGMKKFKWALGLNKLSLGLMGVWPNESDLQGEAAIVRLRVPVMIMAIFTCLFLPQMYALTLVFKELPLVIDNLLTSCSAFTSCIKLYFIWRSKPVLWPVVESARRDWLEAAVLAEKAKEKEHDKENLATCCWELKVMEREAARARLFTVVGYVVLGGCYAGFAFAPLVGINIRMLSNITDYGDRPLMVQSYLPYDYSKSPNYELTHASQLIAGFFIAMAISIPDNYFAALTFHMSAQFEILGGRFERLIAADESRFSSKALAVFINRHVQLIALVKAIEKSFSFVIVAQILCMSIMVCCLGFEILGMIAGGGEHSPLQMITLVGTLFSVMMHTLVDCFASETLSTRSSGFFHNVYNCNWYACISQYDTRLFIPMMILSKDPRKLTAGKIFPLSLSTYCSILKSSAGYISMLIAVNSGR